MHWNRFGQSRCAWGRRYRSRSARCARTAQRARLRHRQRRPVRPAPHTLTCAILGVSVSWFHKWFDREPTERQRRRAELDERVRQLFEASGRTYGSPRIHADLRVEEWRASVNHSPTPCAAKPAKFVPCGPAGRAQTRGCAGKNRGAHPSFSSITSRVVNAAILESSDPAPLCARMAVSCPESSRAYRGMSPIGRGRVCASNHVRATMSLAMSTATCARSSRAEVIVKHGFS